MFPYARKNNNSSSSSLISYLNFDKHVVHQKPGVEVGSKKSPLGISKTATIFFPSNKLQGLHFHCCKKKPYPTRNIFCGVVYLGPEVKTLGFGFFKMYFKRHFNIKFHYKLYKRYLFKNIGYFFLSSRSSIYVHISH